MGRLTSCSLYFFYCAKDEEPLVAHGFFWSELSPVFKFNFLFSRVKTRNDFSIPGAEDAAESLKQNMYAVLSLALSLSLFIEIIFYLS